VIDLNPNDYDAHFEIAALFEQADLPLALQHYTEGINIIRKKINSPEESHYTLAWHSSFSDRLAHNDIAQSMVPPELLNN
jgi:hypothetical protein